MFNLRYCSEFNILYTPDAPLGLSIIINCNCMRDGSVKKYFG
jgi:hypothetical protein